MLKLTSVLKAIGQLYKALTDPTTLKNSNYVEFPNGLKICWGEAYGKYGDVIQLPVTYTFGKLVEIPVYNTYTTMRCNFGSVRLANTNKAFITAYDIKTDNPPTSEKLDCVYIAIGY